MSKTTNNRSRVFEIALGEGEGMETLLGELLSFNVFVTLKATFSKH